MRSSHVSTSSRRPARSSRRSPKRSALPRRRAGGSRGHLRARSRSSSRPGRRRARAPRREARATRRRVRHGRSAFTTATGPVSVWSVEATAAPWPPGASLTTTSPTFSHTALTSRNIASAISGSPSRVFPCDRKGMTNVANVESLTTDNAAIANYLERYASLLDLAGSSYYAVRAYRRAAELIRPLPTPVAELVRNGRARELRGIGPGLEARLRELVETGEIAHARELEGEVEPELVGARPLPRPDAETRRRDRAGARGAHRRRAARGDRIATARAGSGRRAEDGGPPAGGALTRGRAPRAPRPAAEPRARARRVARRGPGRHRGGRSAAVGRRLESLRRRVLVA